MFIKPDQEYGTILHKSAEKRLISRSLRRHFLVILILMAWYYPTFCQDLTFNEVILSEENDFEFVTGITQAENGMMWFATKVGLFRYDGQTLTPYKNNPIYPNSLVSNFAETIFADTNGKIWVGTLGYGLDLFDPETGIFKHYRHNPEDPSSLSNDTVTEILRDRKGSLWVGTHGGLNLYDAESDGFIHFRHDPEDPTSLSNNQVRALYEDRQGILWVGTGSPYADNGGGPEAGGLNWMNRESGTFIHFKHDPADEKSLISNKISAIYEDDRGTLWIGTANYGLHRMNRQEGSFERLMFDPDHPEKFTGPTVIGVDYPYEHITFIVQDSSGGYWYGTVESGLHYFDPMEGVMQRFYRWDTISSGFSSRGAWSAFSSRDGIFWVGSTGGEIYRVNPKQIRIPHFETHAPVNDFYEAQNGDLWIATDNKAIKKEFSNGSTQETIIDLTPNNDKNDHISTIQEDRQGNIWFGGDQGLSLWDQENRKFIHYNHDPENKYSLSNNSIIKIYEDSKANFWVGTVHGINRMDRERGTFERFYLNLTDTGFIGRNIVTSIAEDYLGNLWVGLWNGVGVYLFDPLSERYNSYLSGTNIIFLYEDSDAVLWAGTNFGLFRYNRQSDLFQRYLEPGMADRMSFIIALVEDDQKNLWFTSTNGINRLNPQRTETNTLGKTYGIDGVEFSWKSGAKGRDGTLYFGDETGYYTIDPNATINESKVPEITFTGFRLADQVVVPSSASPLKKDLMHAEEIRLGYDQNVFSFDYAIIDYTNPEENKLTYFLENYDNSWMQPNSEQRAYYFNVPPGNYTFRVKGANSYGIWAEKKINITILPPWYKTWWAYGSYVVLFGLLVFAFDRIQRRRIKAIERQKAYKRELEQAKEIEKAYTELKAAQAQLIHSEKMASLGELTAGIAHEIQNPLNFVNNFSELNTELIAELEEERKQKVRNLENEDELLKNILENEQKINHHGKRADGIVKSMLQHSKSRNNQKEPTNINVIAEEYLRLAYHGLRAKDKSFNADFAFEPDTALPKINVISQDIGRVLLNLINNAFHSVHEKSKEVNGEYKPNVIVSSKKLDDTVEIRVTDNGKGIPDDIRNKIFQPFFTTKPTGEGTGLGLSLAYDIITKGHGGNIKVDTNEKGTSFTITLPVQKKL